jgi:hypothetical protein
MSSGVGGATVQRNLFNPIASSSKAFAQYEEGHIDPGVNQLHGIARFLIAQLPYDNQHCKLNS